MSVGAVVACCALAAACTQEPAQTSSPSPTPLATTPRESQIERQMRLDYEAAEEAYRDQHGRAGPAVSGGWRDRGHSWLEGDGDRLLFAYHVSSRFAMIHDAGWQGDGRDQDPRRSCETAVGRSDRVGLTSCEDNEAVTILDESGQGCYARRTRASTSRSLTIVKVSERWKVVDSDDQ